MSTTSNLSMTVIENDDIASPDPINSNFAILDKLGVDYVLKEYEQITTTGGWHVRIWKSGYCELDGKFEYTLKSDATTVQCHIAWPSDISVKSVYSITASGGVSNTVSSYIKYVGDSAACLDVQLYCGKGDGQNHRSWVMAHACLKVDVSKY